jgi:anaerobic ribonucleoside-triphosphate reductase activating protein
MDFRHDQSRQGVRQTSLNLFLGDSIEATELEGPGLRFALWFSGCSLRCPGCCNPHLFSKSAGSPTSGRDIIAMIEKAQLNKGIEGVSYLGGEPFEQPEILEYLVLNTRALGLTNMVYTGFEIEQIRTHPHGSQILSQVDLLVDGPYLQEKRSTKRRFIGSTNQTLHFLSSAYHREDPSFSESNRLEIRYRSSEVHIHGFPAFPRI